MIITQGPAPLYTQPKVSLPPAPAPEATNDARVEPAAKGGARGLALLASDSAAIILTEQSALQTTPPTAGSTSTMLDLRGRDLREVDLSTLDLRGADLSDANLSGKDLTGLDLRGATMTRANFDGANLTDTNLNAVSASGASFRQASFARTDMNDADFSNARFAKATFQRGDVGMSQGEMEKVGIGFVIKSSNFANADFSNASFQAGGGFDTSNLDDANFEGMKTGSYVGITQSSLKGATFKGIVGKLGIGSSDASGADFTGIMNTSITIGQSKVDNASFKDTSAKLRLADLDLRTVNFSVSEKSLKDITLENNIMTGMNFSGFNFAGGKFISYGSSMVNSFYSDVEKDLKNAVAGTDFRGATFEGVAFHNFDMGRALIDTRALAGVVRHVDNSFDGGSRGGNDAGHTEPSSKSVSSKSSIRQALIDGGVLPDITPALSTPRKQISDGVGKFDARPTINSLVSNNLSMGQTLIDAGAFTSTT